MAFSRETKPDSPAGASSSDGAGPFGCNSLSPCFPLKIGQVQGGWEIPLRTAKATAAVGEDDVTTSAGIPNTNPKAGKHIQRQWDDQRDGFEGTD